MRSLPCSVIFCLAVWLAQSTVLAQTSPKDPPSPAALLKLRPTCSGVEFDTPADQAAIAACKVENVLNSEKRSIGYALRDAQGKLLRRFVVAHGGQRLDQWSYYQDGFEVYREDDLDGDRSLDECRWLNAGGTRIAVMEKGKIKTWKQISAEEASKVLVQALVAGDMVLLETVMATPDGAGGRRTGQGHRGACGRGRREARRASGRASEAARRLEQTDDLEPL